MLFFFFFLLTPLLTFSEQASDKLTYPIIVLETTAGPIDILLFTDVAPKACENFMTLALRGYYNKTLFHRIIPNFLVQGGDPTGTGKKTVSIYGKYFEDEVSPYILFDRPGRVGMANAGPHTNGSQFFISLVETPQLNRKNTIFGQVIRGFEVLKKLESCGSEAGYVSPPQAILRVHFDTLPYNEKEEEEAARALQPCNAEKAS